jgi:hypothetical protein
MVTNARTEDSLAAEVHDAGSGYWRETFPGSDLAGP